MHGRLPRPVLPLALLLVVALSGCVTELLADETVTVRNVACAVLDADGARPVFFELHRERGVGRVALSAMRGVADHLAAEGFGPRERFMVQESNLLEDVGPWTPEALRAWAEEAPVLDGGDVRLHVLWVEAFSEEAATLLQVAPGVVAVNETAVRAGAASLERSETFLARVLVWHAVGHALGAVNEGIPLNGTDAASQEAVPGHEASPESVMHHGWERVATLPRTDAAYGAYSEDVLDDWRAAVGPEGVCA